MKVAVIGASGYGGGPITEEALSRGHHVVAISRKGQAPAHQNVIGRSADVYDSKALMSAIADCEVVIHAFNPGRGQIYPKLFDDFIAGHRSIIDAVRLARIGRLLCMGGAGSLITREGKPLLESSEWPKEYDPFKPGVLGTRELYYLLRDINDFDWVFLCPSSMLIPGPRTGKYRVGGENLLYDSDGVSRISLADFAVAMIDEMESGAHHRARFTVGY